MKKATLCLIFGGKSNEYSVSLRSVYRILSGLDRKKYEIFKIGITKTGEWYLYEGENERILNDTWKKGCVKPLTLNLNKRQITVLGKEPYTIEPDVVFPVLHGEYGEDGRLQGFLDMAGIKYVGCNSFSSHACMDKALAKLRAQEIGVNVAGSFEVMKNSSKDGKKPYIVYGKERAKEEILSMLKEKGIAFPLFVKPTMCGSSVGVSLVNREDELFSSIDKALELSPSALIEEYIEGDETEVGVLKRGDEILVSPAGMIKHRGVFYDYDTKYKSGETEYFIPAPIDSKTEKYIRECAKKLFFALGCGGLARFDFFVKSDGTAVFNEVNTMPGFTDASMFAMLFEQKGLGLGQILDLLIEEALGK